MAEWIARGEATRRGWEGVEVRSAGTLAGAGADAAALARAVARERGMPVSEHHTRPLSPEDLEWADLVVAMSPSHVAAALSIAPECPATLATDFLPERHPQRGAAVPDPIGGGREVYEGTFEILEACVHGLFERLAFHRGS